MIVWVASYPRAGNSLLRTVVYQTMRIGSYNEHQLGQGADYVRSPIQTEITGTMFWEGEREEFFNLATDSKEIFLVKTHHLPRDDQPAIYVVRDGRRTILSYSQFHKNFSKPPYPSLLELILGLEYYGSWTQHFYAWERRDKTLIVKFEDLLWPSEKLLTQLAEIVIHVGRIATWKNPFKELQSKNPDFFREGSPAWSGDTGWSPLLNGIFSHLHGNLMSKLGYMSEADIAEARHLLTQEMIDLIEVTQRVHNENKRYRTICDERLSVIQNLKRAYDHQPSLIEYIKKRLLRSEKA